MPGMHFAPWRGLATLKVMLGVTGSLCFQVHSGGPGSQAHCHVPAAAPRSEAVSHWLTLPFLESTGCANPRSAMLRSM